mgnify:CR=1 FL=1
MKKYTLIDVFSGIGGFHNGFLNTERFEMLLAADYNQDCESFHRKNLGTCKVALHKHSDSAVFLQK